MFDCHVHSSFSGDSEMKCETACDTAINLGLHGITFTDHLDYDYPDFDDTFLIDFDIYSKYIDELKPKYSKFKVFKGIEVGVQPHVIKESNEVVEKYDFDFVIASVHIIDHQDPYQGRYYIGKSKEEAFRRYLEEILHCTKLFDNYDVIGHIGYVRRYCSYDDKTLRHCDYSDVLDSILKAVISKGKGIEVNTSGYRDIGSPIPDFDIVRRYRELGGEIITLGSDAHSPQYIGLKFGDVKSMLADIGFKYLAHFEQRKPVFERI